MVAYMRKYKRIDLLSISDIEKVKLIWEIRRQLQQKVLEEKLMQPLLKVEPSAINKELIRKMSESLNGVVSKEALTWLTS
jgi:hypothetical protein